MMSPGRVRLPHPPVTESRVEPFRFAEHVPGAADERELAENVLLGVLLDRAQEVHRLACKNRVSTNPSIHLNGE